MQVVIKKIENAISEKLRSLPVDPSDHKTTFFVPDDQKKSVRATASRIKRDIGMEFKTRKERAIDEKTNQIVEGIVIWKIKE